VRELCLKYQNIDPVTELVPVRPVVHYMMGGVHTDIDGATPITGLYAAGEVACVSINGANRLGSNSLPECLVFGARAGRAAAEQARQAPEPGAAASAQARDEEARLRKLLDTADGTEPIADLRVRMQQTMEDAAGIYRTGAELAKGADTLRELQDRARSVAVEDHSRTFNTQLVAALELANMLDVAEAIIESAVQRTESRGAHQRTDHPARDDEHFLAHSLIRRGREGEQHVELVPVTLTRWPPAERVYGR
jgi:fumarate reductase flavoprotein subunit